MTAHRTFIAAALILLSTSAVVRADDNPATVVTADVAPRAERRPLVLPVLYASFAGLQALDVYSTRAGVARGATELNPIVSPFADNAAGMIALKAVGTATTIAIAEGLWHRNRTAAIVTMVAANGVMALVAANNARVLHQIH